MSMGTRVAAPVITVRNGVVTRTGNVVTPFRPLSVTADGDVAVPLRARRGQQLHLEREGHDRRRRRQLQRHVSHRVADRDAPAEDHPSGVTPAAGTGFEAAKSAAMVVRRH
jgi:hypothetical protein